MIAAALLCVAGCTTGSSSGGYQEPTEATTSGKRLSETAPTAREMENPLDADARKAMPSVTRNGNGDAANGKVRKPASPIVEEAVTLRTDDVYGTNFPGVGEAPVSVRSTTDDAQRTAEREAVARHVEQTEARLAELERMLADRPDNVDARIATLESRIDSIPEVSPVLEAQVRELEAKLAAVEAREPRVIETTPDTIDLRIRELEAQYSALRAQDPAAADAALAERLAEMEHKLARVEGRPAPPAGMPADDLEARFAEVEGRLAALQDTPNTKVETENLQAQVRDLEAKIAAIEGRAPQQIPESSGNEAARIAEMEAQLSALRQANPEQAFAAMDQRLREMEAKLAAEEGRPPRIIETSPENIDSRFAELEAQLAELRRPAPSVEDSYTQAQIRELEAKIAALEGRVPVATAASSSDVDARIRQLEAHLAELQARPADTTIEPDVLASLEGRYLELDRKIDALRSTPVKNAATDDRLLLLNERYTRLEEDMATLRAGKPVGTDPVLLSETVDARFDSVEARLDQIRVEMASAAEAGGLLDRLYVAGGGGGGSGGGYRIGAGDLLDFQSYNDPALSRELTVRYDGHISLPLIPDIGVSNMTRESAETQVRDAYRRIFRDPQISLLVRETGSKTYTVVGDIESPGVYPYDRALRLIDAVSLAGGLRRRNSSSSVGGFVGITGQLTKCFVIRSSAEGRDVIQYDLRGLGDPGTHAADAVVLPGDLLYIPEGVNLVYLLGESRNPVIVELTEGMTMLQMLSLSGGFNSSTARLRNVVLLRQTNEEDVEVLNLNVNEMLKTGKDIRLNPGDIIYVPRKAMIRLQEFVSRITGSITPILQMYTSAVDAYYANDIARALTEEPSENNTLRVLGQIESFGTSTQNIADLFGAP